MPIHLQQIAFQESDVYRITGLIENNNRSKIKAEKMLGDLYEPAANALHVGVIYAGETDKISRFDTRMVWSLNPAKDSFIGHVAKRPGYVLRIFRPAPIMSLSKLKYFFLPP